MARKLSRTDFNFCLDAVLLTLFVALCACSTIREFVFPPGPEARGWTLWGRSYSDWSRYQFAILATMAAAVLLHVMLHWSWVCGVVRNRLGSKRTGSVGADDPNRTLWGVGLLIVIVNLIGAIVAVAELTIKSPSPGLF